MNDPVAEYLERSVALIQRLVATQLPAIERAGDLVAGAIAADGLVHVFGAGHSHILAEELFYRSGGLAAVNPILREELMLHQSARGATRRERESGLGAEIFGSLAAAPGDVLIVASNSGGSVVTAELAEAAREAGIPVIAIFSFSHANSSASLKGAGSPLERIADVTIDNCGVAGDAAVCVDGVPARVGPTSTIAGAAIVNAIAIRAVALAAAAGEDPGIFASSNIAGGDAQNRALFERYGPRVRAL